MGRRSADRLRSLRLGRLSEEGARIATIKSDRPSGIRTATYRQGEAKEVQWPPINRREESQLTIMSASQSSETFLDGSKRNTALRAFLKKWISSVFIFRNPFKIYEYGQISRLLRGQRAGALLDLGCGVGVQSILLSRRFFMTMGVDISEPTLRRARERINRLNKHRIQFILGDLIELRLDPASVDAVVSFNVLQLIPHWQETLTEVFRLLRPGGQMIICVDSLADISDPSVVQAHQKAYCVHHYFSERDLTQTLRSLGFRSVEVHSIFRSAYAERLFTRGIREDFRFGRLEAVVASFRLRLSEMRARVDEKGIKLIANATK